MRQWSSAGLFWYLLTILAFLLANILFKFDQDVGGYEDKLRTKDKVWHFLGCAFAAMFAVILFRIHPVGSWVLTSLGGVGFEFTQGFVSKWDIAADTAGSAVGSALGWAIVTYL